VATQRTRPTVPGRSDALLHRAEGPPLPGCPPARLRVRSAPQPAT